ncbi:riboflavin synthase [Oscillatoria sp. FACHB-1406]|uniref:riboflavin synthase n=1 Tax=Oscillatoria sp. FACHB-1406 TaxID=2692846 RepID=UPI0016828738|nr:riboflavin synthase [Oscillatoria sp. FACHB-1406]MBD2578371.1 riboflavin synthase [Oscillatoria sp. FACHB-1406]
MFTGLIQALGRVRPLGSDRWEILPASADSELILGDLAIGDSVAVDGACLTAEEISPNGFTAVVSPETLRRTRLGQIDPALDWANLETSLRVGSKIGGHFVTGHVDSVGCLLESVRTAQAWEMTFGSVSSLRLEWEDAIARYLVDKGSISVNGISLTIAECDPGGNWFKVAVIPHTYDRTNLKYLQPGSWVNLEADILGKYVDKLLVRHSSAAAKEEEISLAFLAEHGY